LLKWYDDFSIFYCYLMNLDNLLNDSISKDLYRNLFNDFDGNSSLDLYLFRNLSLDNKFDTFLSLYYLGLSDDLNYWSLYVYLFDDLNLFDDWNFSEYFNYLKTWNLDGYNSLYYFRHLYNFLDNSRNGNYFLYNSFNLNNSWYLDHFLDNPINKHSLNFNNLLLNYNRDWNLNSNFFNNLFSYRNYF
jgi:hypothetical protein